MTNKPVKTKKAPTKRQKKRRTKVHYPHDYLVGTLRRIWRWSPSRRALKATVTKCTICGKESKDLQVDHIVPVGTVPKGWKGWDGYLKRMFDGKLQMLCRVCHKNKTRQDLHDMAEKKAARKLRPPKDTGTLTDKTSWKRAVVRALKDRAI
jgi:5-methylcytosine-specific restriction endonuclease McrA